MQPLFSAILVSTQIAAAPVNAATEKLPLRSESLISSDFVFSLLMILIIMFGLAYLALKLFVKPLLDRKMRDSKPLSMQIIQTLRLSPRSRLLLLQIDSQKVLVGESPNGLEIKFVPNNTEILNPESTNQKQSET